MNKYRFILYLFLSFFVFISCSKDPYTQKVDEIKSMEKELYESKSLNRDKGLKMIDSYLAFFKAYPKDSASANYLFKAGEIAMNLQLGTQSIYYFDKLTANFPNFHKAPECLFLKAFIYENQMQDLKSAEKYYKDFINKYPDHQLKKDAEASLKYLGKSPEELIKLFQDKNKE